MAPTKNSTATRAVSTISTTSLMPLARKGLTRRSAALQVQDQNVDNMQTRGKRKAEHSPIKNEKIKRSALGNLTNNVKANTQLPEEDAKHQQKLQQHHQSNFTKKKENLIATQIPLQVQSQAPNQTKETNTSNAAPAGVITRQAQNKVQTRQGQKNGDEQTVDKKVRAAAAAAVAASNRTASKNHKKRDHVALPAAPIALAVPTHITIKPPHKPMRRISNEFNKTEESLYMSALEDVSSCESMRLSGNFEAAKRRSVLLQQQEKSKTEVNTSKDENVNIETADAAVVVEGVPVGVEDFDRANWNDPFQVSNYAMDIFNYLKAREQEFQIEDYMTRQLHLSKWMRSLLVDWMVEVQETFELNHETLYLAVKIVDLFLCRVIINKEKLQLLGAAALFIACKFDERTPTLVEDFLYICDGAYKHDELIHMEMLALRTIDYDLGIPLSYRFLRRYARCAKVPMPTLTLARYILELSLMDYATISFSDSKLAAAALFIALRLHGSQKVWNSTLEYYTGYKLAEFAEIVPVLNAGIHRKPKGTIKTIRSKYSHKIFHEVAKVTLQTSEQLFENDLDLSIRQKLQIQNEQQTNT